MRSNVVGSVSVVVILMRYTFCLLIRSGTLNETQRHQAGKVLDSIEKGREKERKIEQEKNVTASKLVYLIIIRKAICYNELINFELT